LISTIYGKWTSVSHSAKKGFKFGILVGAFVGLGIGLLNYQVLNMSNRTSHLADGVISIISFGLMVVIIALIYKVSSKKEV